MNYFRPLFFLLMLVSCLGKNKMQTSVISQANELGRNLIRNEMDTYLDKMAYFVYSNKEERELLRQNILKQQEFEKARNTDFTKAITLKNSEIFENQGYYQCIVKQVRYFTNSFTTYTNDYYLLAVSQDGDSWKFADITHISRDILAGVFKEMHPDLDIVKEEAGKKVE
jgi:hypothetical protein